MSFTDQIPMNEDLIFSIGRFLYVFLRCEHQVKYYCDIIETSQKSRETIYSRGMTSGDISKKFYNLIENTPRKILVKSSDRDKLLSHASDFKNLVDIRNGIVHSSPCTRSQDGKQLLNRINNMIDSEYIYLQTEAAAEFNISNDYYTAILRSIYK